jgi:hypothetical protein
MNQREDQRDGFYVGYLPVPPAHRRFLVRAIPIIAAVMILGALLIAFGQRSPGNGVFESSVSSVTGTLIIRPYPMLIEQETGGVVLLVEQGKHGGRDSLAEHAATTVTCTGLLLRRDGRRMLELLPGADGVTATGVTATAVAMTPQGAPVELSGEILDSKCALGAMKPGDGKAHKACATLCVRGGIPPMFRWDEGGIARYALIVTAEGGPANSPVLPFIGEPVTLTGRPSTLGSLDVIMLEPGSIRRAGL